MHSPLRYQSEENCRGKITQWKEKSNASTENYQTTGKKLEMTERKVDKIGNKTMILAMEKGNRLRIEQCHSNTKKIHSFLYNEQSNHKEHILRR